MRPWLLEATMPRVRRETLGSGMAPVQLACEPFPKHESNQHHDTITTVLTTYRACRVGEPVVLKMPSSSTGGWATPFLASWGTVLALLSWQLPRPVSDHRHAIVG